MSITISVHSDTCIRCGRCAVVCPANILQQKEKKGDITVVGPRTCIRCGHCLDVCPTGSIEHSALEPSKFHVLDYTKLPTAEQLMELFHARRSNRSMQADRPIPAEAIAQIEEAARYAPTAANNLKVHTHYIDDRARLDRIIDFVIDMLTVAGEKMGVMAQFEFRHLRQVRQAGGDPIMRNGSGLLLFTSDTAWGEPDCNLAYQNASLMAEVLGISQVWMGYMYTAIRNADAKVVADLFETKEKICACMSLGIPAFRYPRYMER